jgi:hypothetical protein
MILISETLDCVEVPIAGTRNQIFFELRRTIPERRRLQDLDMVVESAYPADPRSARAEHPRPRAVRVAGWQFVSPQGGDHPPLNAKGRPKAP